MRRVGALVATLAASVFLPAAAQAAIPSIPADASGGGSISCTTVPDGPNAG